MQTQNRPLSPHLQVYKFPLTAITSIMHRISGVALSVGTLLLIYWLTAAAAGPEQYERAQGVLGSFLGQLVLFAFTYALFYHLCNGIRHLFWDAGKGFEIETSEKTGYAAIGIAAALTVLVWIIAYAAGGA
ncbi:MAG: succinate dehydrogenase, cytochrome b556 subunit [Ectothiorhodospiraceae bacterium]|nr:succinate dehydrogenase, cytochrome b556 subunit [Ectothiorhodospiraceae bacterium]MCH8505120.1 succinate dehydrogenase, cytochrome b556 subunit [Ectothiorhodospiraceae bacterium]